MLQNEFLHKRITQPQELTKLLKKLNLVKKHFMFILIVKNRFILKLRLEVTENSRQSLKKNGNCRTNGIIGKTTPIL